MFFLTPYYHTAFPNIKLMIVMDLDLEFRSVCLSKVQSSYSDRVQSNPRQG